MQSWTPAPRLWKRFRSWPLGHWHDLRWPINVKQKSHPGFVWICYSYPYYSIPLKSNTAPNHIKPFHPSSDSLPPGLRTSQLAGGFWKAFWSLELRFSTNPRGNDVDIIPYAVCAESHEKFSKTLQSRKGCTFSELSKTLNILEHLLGAQYLRAKQLFVWFAFTQSHQLVFHPCKLSNPRWHNGIYTALTSLGEWLLKLFFVQGFFSNEHGSLAWFDWVLDCASVA